MIVREAIIVSPRHRWRRAWAVVATLLLALGAAVNAGADGYTDALTIVESMSDVSSANLQAVLAAQQQGRVFDALGQSARVAKQMRSQEDRVWLIYMEEPTLAVQALFLASQELTRFWLAELAIFSMLARGPGMAEFAQGRLELAQLCEQAFATCVEQAELYWKLGM